MRKFIITVRQNNYEEKWATTNNYQTAVRYALEAILANKGRIVKIQ